LEEVQTSRSETSAVEFIENGDFYETPLHYKPQDGESLIYDDLPTALSMIKPKWDGERWIETAATEELATIKRSVSPSNEVISLSLLEERIAKLESTAGTFKYLKNLKNWCVNLYKPLISKD